MVTAQGPEPEQAPLHPAKVEPIAGAGVKATLVPIPKLALQVAGQDIPPGLLSTRPVPVPFSVTVSVTEGSGAAAVKVAATVGLPTMTTVHDELVPLQPAPLKPLNVDPLAGVALIVTLLPVANSAAHVPGQEIPLGLLVTMPMPLPPTVTVSRSVETATLNRAVTVALLFTKQAAVPEQAPLHPANTEPAFAAAFSDTVVPS